MKKITLSFALLLGVSAAFAGTPTTVKLISATENSTIIEFNPGELSLKNVTTPNGTEQIISLDKGSPLLIAGAPDLAKLTSAVIIPDMAHMGVNVISSNYYDIPGVNVAPSKGNFMRTIDPANVPYTYGNMYSQNSFYPAALSSLSTPYILRDYRAQAVQVCPFQYNPQTKVLRVYTKIVVAVTTENAMGGENSFDRMTAEKIADMEFDAIYGRQFINYAFHKNNDANRYSVVAENGCMLVICFDSFAPDMAPFVNWKNRKGIATEMVLKSAVGTTAAQVKTYIMNYYASHPTLKYVLLVGDAAQIPCSSKTDAWGTPNDSDNNYAYLTGADSYPEIFIGRFSAQTNAHVQTMVKRSTDYEEIPQAAATWYKKGIAIASDQGPGDDGEMDYQHQRNLRTQLMAYTYNAYSEFYDGSQGGVDASGNPSAASVGTAVNAGAGLITYTGHGSDFAFSTSGFSTTQIATLTNTTMHPFVWSVACVNGNFVSNSSCFAEAWLRAGTPSAPKGALSTLMSTINQSWNPPMEGQDAMVAILVESVSGNIKRTFGGLSMNGCMQMNDVYGPNGAQMTDTWTLFGDPSVMVYSDTPAPMTTSHIATAPVGTTSITVNNNVNGALVCLSMSGAILGTGISDGTSAVITIPAATIGVIDVTATAYNKMTYTGIINVSSSTGINESNNASLFNVYPVPANNTLNVSAMMSTAGKVKVTLFNNLGQQVMEIANEEVGSGAYTKTVDISTIARGAYFCKLETGNTIITQHVIVTK